ncbi:cinnamate-4-hydroxylase [Corchorus olitorius]|uniref:Cinnamate-4-hydroxylase n=1 Tax=Corchorus olitorius TaxID=93759 RepID=A0A1R3KCN3_9ROSI|nr:cinnamate-4-hydroxylase [Corchorus olitorius]
MAQGSIPKTMVAVFVTLVLSMATATISAQDVGMAPGPAP